MKAFPKFFITALILVSFFISSCENLASTVESDSSSEESTTETSTKTSGSSSSDSSSSSESESESEDDTSSSGTSSSSGTGSSAATTSASVSYNWNYSLSSPIYQLSSDATELVISGVSKDQTIYLSKTNPTASSISASATQYISAAENLTLTDSESSSSSSSSGSGSSSSSFPSPGSRGGPGRNHFIPASFSTIPEGNSSSARSAASASEVEQISPVIGSTTKEIYIDADSSISTYRAANATLRAMGDYCYIWVVDGFYETDESGSYTYTNSNSRSYTTSSDEQITEEQAQSLAETFDAIYPMIRNVFGEESDEIYYEYSGSSFSTKAMNYLSDTGTMVNIVVYDIGADHSDDDSSGVLGYFYAKDYYPDGDSLESTSGTSYSSSDVRNYSNEGKYFYIDAYYTSTETQMMYSTIAHEFQHMIHWGVKYMEQGLSSSTGFNEMLSMLCEDMMQDYLGVSDSDSPKGRLPMFEQCYTDCGLEYRSSSSYYQILSYSANYAFGCWIARQFGGAKVISQMSQNDEIDTDAIVEAVNSVNGTSYTIEDLLKMYSIACIIEADSTDTYDWPSFNQSSELSSSDSLYYSNGDAYSYPLTAINLWTLEESLADFYEIVCASSNSSYYKFDGPELYGYNVQKSIRPYGMTLVEVGTVTEDDTDVTITFGNTSPSSSEKVYVIVR